MKNIINMSIICTSDLLTMFKRLNKMPDIQNWGSHSFAKW